MSLTESMRTMYLEQNYPFHKGSKYRDIIVVHKFPSACTHFFFLYNSFRQQGPQIAAFQQAYSKC